MEQNLGDDRSRFHVSKIDTPQPKPNSSPFFCDDDGDNSGGGGMSALQVPGKVGGQKLKCSVYVCPTESYNYEGTFLASLHAMTREAFPREMNYRNIYSIAKAGAAGRPTLPELLHEDGERKEVCSSTLGKYMYICTSRVVARRFLWSSRRYFPQDAEVAQESKKGIVKLGWILGVFLPCLLNIWGVMLFLRLTWVMGQGGGSNCVPRRIVVGVALLTLCNLVTTITALSVSAVSTNGQIKGAEFAPDELVNIWLISPAHQKRKLRLFVYEPSLESGEDRCKVKTSFVRSAAFGTVCKCCVCSLLRTGGIYYMISRSLGAEFGGAIGLMFWAANCIACAMHTIGFCEAVQEMMRADFKTWIVDDAKNDIRIIGVIALIFCLLVCIVGMQWVARIQVVLLVMLLAAQVAFIVGAAIGPYTDEQRAQGFLGFDWEVFKSNFAPKFSVTDGEQHSFFSVFAVYFPAVTGIVAGANLSGDLKDPSYAIPLGTLAAIVGTFFSYILLGLISTGAVMRTASGNVTELYLMGVTDNSTTPTPFLLNALDPPTASDFILSQAFQCDDRDCKYGLLYNYQTMTMISSWGPMIYIGCFAASLSSAIATLCSGPRILMAMAQDKLYPGLGPFAVGWGPNQDPIRGYMICFLVAVGFLLIAELNAVGTLTSNFYLAAYSLINFCVFHAELMKSPGWRPGFKYYTAWLSLIGTVLCIAAMFLINWITALITYGLIIIFYLFVWYRKPDANWGSSMQAAAYSGALKSSHDLWNIEEHVKNFRPQILCMSGFPGVRPPLVDFANLITKQMSLLVCGNVIPVSFIVSHHQRPLMREFEELDY
ncbi:unnamed protein product [Notodromas monacha]|uniref:Amino acid permease/ SLC12A domain-containing protein n=1 Tax=Notodromas monacha TaxID=399045 RepID=A0A7R9BBQ6_9CRUS|nr:unnamed protein product [Notodromas monacha]CAG0912315.1 unnamed protein product [Notodromas monacha]